METTYRSVSKQFQKVLDFMNANLDEQGVFHMSDGKIAKGTKLPQQQIKVILTAISAEDGLVETVKMSLGRTGYRPKYTDLSTCRAITDIPYVIFMESLMELKGISNKAEFLEVSNWTYLRAKEFVKVDIDSIMCKMWSNVDYQKALQEDFDDMMETYTDKINAILARNPELVRNK